MFDFLGIGAQKAGTTWLYAQLKQHPDVWMPMVKELHFFSFRSLGAFNAKGLQTTPVPGWSADRRNTGKDGECVALIAPMERNRLLSEACGRSESVYGRVVPACVYRCVELAPEGRDNAFVSLDRSGWGQACQKAQSERKVDLPDSRSIGYSHVFPSYESRIGQEVHGEDDIRRTFCRSLRLFARRSVLGRAIRRAGLEETQ